MNETHKPLEVNGRRYAWPAAPVAVICCDGSEPDYTETAMADGLMPNLARMLEHGQNLRARSVVPSFTNPNNLSIVTGRPPAVHGISGNFFLEPASGEAVMMNDARFLRVPTIFQAFQDAGAKVVVLTAKDKLRSLLAKGLRFEKDRVIAFSSEKSADCTLAGNGIEDVPELVGMPVPDIYSAELSEFVFAAGVKLMERLRPELMYLSTTDYVQHKCAPGEPAANAFYAMMDRYLGQLDAAGATIVLTADHGMNAKHRTDGSPNVLYLQDLLDDWLTPGAAKVILPITDPYVAHHGALGSYATVYLPTGTDVADLAARIGEVDGIAATYTRQAAAARFELPAEYLGDLVVLGEKHKVIGSSAAEHDLSGLDVPLRSHGGVSEETVPFLINRECSLSELGLDVGALRNFDAFFAACNCRGGA